MSRSRMRLLVIGCFAVLLGLACLAAWQIIKVNEDTPKATIEEHSMGETIRLDGSFLENVGEENKDYTVRINKAERISYNDYVSHYGTTKSETKTGEDDKSIISVEMTITNEGSSMGCLDVYDMRLLPESKNTYYIPQETLWKLSESNLTPWPSPISIEPGTSYTVHVPFTVNTEGSLITEGYIKGHDFTLYLTDWPTSKRVVFNLDD